MIQIMIAQGVEERIVIDVEDRKIRRVKYHEFATTSFHWQRARESLRGVLTGEAKVQALDYLEATHAMWQEGLHAQRRDEVRGDRTGVHRVVGEGGDPPPEAT